MNYKSIILNKLLDKYERSKSLNSGCNRRVILKMQSLKEYNIENFEQKKIFHDTVLDLQKIGLIEYSWKKFEKRKYIK